MKKWLLMFSAVVFLAGCGSQETFETVEDVYAPVEPQYGEVFLSLPDEAAAEVMESADGCKLYCCDGYDILLETVEAGDLNGTIRAMTGIAAENLTILETKQGDCSRYDFVWSSVSDDGEQVCRGAVLNDGAGHYCLSVQSGAGNARDLQENWNSLFQSFGVSY